MVYYDTSAMYFNSATSIQERIVRLEAILLALETSVLIAVESAYIQEYTLNDGMTTIKCNYRDTNQVIASMTAIENLINRLRMQLNRTREVTLKDKSSFYRRY